MEVFIVSNAAVSEFYCTGAQSIELFTGRDYGASRIDIDDQTSTTCFVYPLTYCFTK